MTSDALLARAIRTVPDFPKPGIQFKDVTPLLGDAGLLRCAADLLAAPYQAQGVTKVIGIESRGFILGAMLADRLEAGFVPVRKQGKLPYTVVRTEYALEYGTDVIEMHVDAVAADDVILIHDDVIATGGTAAACYDLVKGTGAKVAGYAFLLELTFLSGRHRLPEGVPCHVAVVT